MHRYFPARLDTFPAPHHHPPDMNDGGRTRPGAWNAAS
ncbi:hypothetical protein ABIC09_002968 [Bradyrhizobium sp. S3.12.5]